MSDRHIRRSGDDYRDEFLNLLPQGLAWRRYIDSTMYMAINGLAQIWGYVDGRAADLLERESDPRTTIELLPDWERNWGLPDPCFPPQLTIGQRQAFLVQRMTIQGGQSRQFFIDVAAQLGYNITITEYRPFYVAMDACGDNRVYGDGTDPMLNQWGQPILDTNGTNVALGELSEWPNYGLGPDINRYYWKVHVHKASLTWFRCSQGQCGVDPHLIIGLAQDLECVLNRWKPAHTEIIFDYSNLTPDDPMAGTP